MVRKCVWIGVVFVITALVVLTSCGGGAASPTTTTSGPLTGAPPTSTQTATAPVATKPQYGGTMSFAMPAEPLFDLRRLGTSRPGLLSHEYVWGGDWTKGPAGGYGTNEISWTEMSTNLPPLNEGVLAESIKWTVNTDKQEVVTVLKIRQGVHFALDSNKEASRLANGREVTADDVAYCFDQWNNSPDSMNYQMFPQDRGVTVVKTGQWELTLTLPFDKFLDTAMRTFGLAVIYPPEVWQKYGGKAASDPKGDVGTGPFMMTDYVAGSTVTLKKNPNYWKKNPLGPGKGDQLPYIDSIKYYILVDASTREAALRTGKIDLLSGMTPEEAAEMKNRLPELKKTQGGWGAISPMYLRVDQAPFSDVKVRRALLMATDLVTINDSLYGGLGQILSWPTWKAGGYEGLYLGLDDPECPADVKELYVYSSDKAKQMLADAGYPQGLAIDLTLVPAGADYYSIVKDQWSKVGVTLNLKLIETNTLMPVTSSRKYQAISVFYPPPSTYPEQAAYTNPANYTDGAVVDDPYVNEMAVKARRAAVTDYNEAMKITKELMKYVLAQAYVVPTPRYPQYILWRPWIKNYSGELCVGYQNYDDWVKYVWIDQAQKKSMGY